MSSRLIRDALLACGIISAGIVAFLNRDTLYEKIGTNPQEFIQSRMTASNATSSASNNASIVVNPNNSNTPNTTTILKSKDGQFWAQAQVNHRDVRFLVDTGASLVVLTPQDAKNAGLRPNTLTYDVPVNTAAGQIMAARTDIAVLSINGVVVHNVKAAVIPKGLHTSLLGMSYLGELRKMELTAQELSLHQ